MSMRPLLAIAPAAAINAGAWLGYIQPAVAALASLATFVWAVIEVWESETVRSLMRRPLKKPQHEAVRRWHAPEDYDGPELP